jgi:hypothetical protein
LPEGVEKEFERGRARDKIADEGAKKHKIRVGLSTRLGQLLGLFFNKIMDGFKQFIENSGLF